MRTAPWRALNVIRVCVCVCVCATPRSLLTPTHRAPRTTHHAPRAALARQVPFVYHLVLYAGRLTAAQRAPADTAFFAINVGAFAALAARCWPCTAARATRGRIKTLLLQFILTFVVQMLMVRLALRRPHPNPHPHPDPNPNPKPNPNQGAQEEGGRAAHA